MKLVLVLVCCSITAVYSFKNVPVMLAVIVQEAQVTENRWNRVQCSVIIPSATASGLVLVYIEVW